MEEDQKLHDAALSLAVRAGVYANETDDIMIVAARFLEFLKTGVDSEDEEAVEDSLADELSGEAFAAKYGLPLIRGEA